MEDEFYMRKALVQAEYARDAGEVPVGAVVVSNDKIIAKAYNQVELLKDTTAHAEILALTAAFDAMGSKYLPYATLYVTLEPCLMCSGALYWSKIGRIVYGASDAKNGYRHYFENHPEGLKKVMHPKTKIKSGVLEEECAALMKDFFKKLR